LKAIGAVKDNKKDTYQDSVTIPLNREHDDDAGGDADEGDSSVVASELSGVLTAIPKVGFVS
jgi:hypothetical protein